MTQDDETQPEIEAEEDSGAGLAGTMAVMVRRENGGMYYGPIGGYKMWPGDRVCAIDRETCRIMWSPVRRLTRHQNSRRVLRVGLKSGRAIAATDNHDLVSLDAEGNLIRVPLKSLAIDTPIPYAGAIPVEPGPTTTWVVPEGAKHNAYAAAEFAVDADLGWIHGLYLAEGWITQNKKGTRCFSFANISVEVLGRVTDFFTRHGIHSVARSGRDDGKLDRVVVNWKQFGDRLSADFGNGSYLKQIPGWVFSASEEYRRGLIGGYLCGDGIFTTKRSRTQIGGGSRSLALRDGLCDLLTTLRIGTTLHEKAVNTGPHGCVTDQYGFQVHAEHLHLLPATGHPRKDGLAAGELWSGKRSADWIPMYPALRRLLSSKTRRSERGRRHRIYYDQHTRASVAAILGQNAEDQSGNWLRSAVWWDHVTSIRELPAARHGRVFGIDAGGSAVMCNVGVFVQDSTSQLCETGGTSRCVALNER